MPSFEEIEDCFPEGAMTNWTGNTIVSAQWLHDFAHAVATKECEACADLADELSDCSGAFIAERIRERSNV